MHLVQDGRQIGARQLRWRHIMDHIARSLFDARIAALTGAGIKRKPPLIADPGMGFFWGLLRNLALGGGAVR